MPPIADSSERRCIHCDQPLHTCEQHWTHKPEIDLLVDCRNPECALYMVTATWATYRETVEPFLAQPAASWRERM